VFAIREPLMLTFLAIAKPKKHAIRFINQISYIYEAGCSECVHASDYLVV